MKIYSTVYKEASAEQVIEKSRFIVHVRPVDSREEAEEFFARIRKEYKDATHNVPAMVIGEGMQVQWASDDGEPQGTSGAPMVQLLVGQGITNTAICVTRYFGGIKLGTGGLVRAYTSSARLGIEAAGICDVEEMICLGAEIDYTHLGKLQNLQEKYGFTLDNISYGERVGFELVTPLEREDEAGKLLEEITSGSCLFTGSRTGLVRKLR